MFCKQKRVFYGNCLNMKTIQLEKAFSFASSTPSSNNIVEGQGILNSKHLFLVGKTNNENDKINLYCLCVRSSSTGENPHVKKGQLKINNQEVIVEFMTCSCTAGSGHACKHVVAVLLYCTQHDVEKLELVSCTDVKCVWNRMKGPILDMYKPQPLETFCCLLEIEKFNLQVEGRMQDCIFNELEKCDNLSAISKHKHRKRKIIENNNETSAMPVMNDTDFNNNNYNVDDKSCIQAVLKSAYHSKILKEIQKLEICIEDCCKQKYNIKITESNAFDIALKTVNSVSDWKTERQFRVTDSRCYSLYTYANNKKRSLDHHDWKKRAYAYCWPRPFTNKYIKHGISQQTQTYNNYITTI